MRASGRILRGVGRSAAVLALEERRIDQELLREQMVSKDTSSRYQVEICRSRPQQVHKQPMAMHSRVPVEAAIERRMQFSRRPELGVVIDNMIELVWVLPRDRGKRELRKP